MVVPIEVLLLTHLSQSEDAIKVVSRYEHLGWGGS